MQCAEINGAAYALLFNAGGQTQFVRALAPLPAQGAVHYDSYASVEVLQEGSKAIDWNQRNPVAGGNPGRFKKGIGLDPASLANLVVVFIPPPSPTEALIPIALHVAFIVRVVRARLAAARQRARDLETFQRLHASDQASPGRPTV